MNTTIPLGGSHEESLFWKENSKLHQEYYKANEYREIYTKLDKVAENAREDFHRLNRLLELAFNHIQELQKRVSNESNTNTPEPNKPGE